MKNNKIATILISILIVVIVGALGFLMYQLFMSATEPSNTDPENDRYINTEENTIHLNTIKKSDVENETNTIIEPVLNELYPNSGNEVEPNISDNVSTYYYYSQLDPIAQEIYNGFKKNKDNLASGTYTIDYGTAFNTLLNGTDGENALNEAFQAAWDAFSYDNIDLFYIDVSKMTLTNEYHSLGGVKSYKISIGPGNNQNYFIDNFSSEEEVRQTIAYFEDLKKQMTEQTSNNTDYDKMRRIHDWIVYYIKYEYQENNKVQHNIYGALKNGKAVCEGYARTFKYFMNGVGIPCILVSGTGTNSSGQTESHAWNYVQIDNKWYAIDTTWDDPIIQGENQQLPQDLKYKYFLKGSDNFFIDHKEDGKLSGTGKVFQFPELSITDYQTQQVQ